MTVGRGEECPTAGWGESALGDLLPRRIARGETDPSAVLRRYGDVRRATARVRDLVGASDRRQGRENEEAPDHRTIVIDDESHANFDRIGFIRQIFEVRLRSS